MERACENCASPDDELLLVQRLYPGKTDGDFVDADGPAELWCYSCASQYPNRPEDG
ncbi:MAG: hypothetical protein ACRDV9_05645 [Acidimicrobiia bacterium]